MYSNFFSLSTENLFTLKMKTARCKTLVLILFAFSVVETQNCFFMCHKPGLRSTLN